MSKNRFEVKIPKYMYEVDKDWGHTYGDDKFIEALMKVVCGWALGSTFSHFMVKLGFAEEGEDERGLLTPTRFGREFAYFYYQKGHYKSKFLYEGIDYE